MTRLTVLAAALVVGTGCASVATLQSAHTLGTGELQAAVEPSMLVAPDLRDLNSAALTSASIRYGVGDRVDAFGRFSVGSTTLGTKLMLTPPTGRWALALAPSLGMGLPMVLGQDVPIDTVWMADLPLLIGVPVNEGELVLGAKGSLGLLVGTEQLTGDPSEHFALAGGLIGFAPPSRGSVGLMPEVSVLVPVLGEETASLGTDIPRQGAIVSFGVGLMLGGS